MAVERKGRRGSVVLALVILVALDVGGCVGTNLPPAPPPSILQSASASPVASLGDGALPNGILVRFDDPMLSADGRLLTLSFVGGPTKPDPCARKYEGWASVQADALEAAVVDVTTPPTPTDGSPLACDAVGHPRTVAVALPAPFTGLRVDDRAGYVHFLRRPPGLAELPPLRAGWTLRSEADVPESRTGRWLRTYAPRADTPAGTSRGQLEFYEAWDGGVDVTGGPEVRTVSVAGRSATLYRFAPDGELVLVWQLGSDGLALVANEADFPAEQLVALAARVDPPTH